MRGGAGSRSLAADAMPQLSVLLGLLAALLAPTGCERSTAPERPNVLLVTLDTTRADHLGLYGYARPTSPHLDALAREAVVFERAYSTSSWTLPAHASLFTGRFPSSHGARHDPEGALVLADAIDAPPDIRARGLGAAETTLAEVLSGQGYRTGAVVAGPWLLREFGLGRGFAHYDDAEIHEPGGRRARQVSEAATRWLEATPEPFFLFLNYFDPHAPYAPPAPWLRSFLPPGEEPNLRSARQAPALYDAEILYMDSELGRLFRELRERGLWERTLIVVTSDHGELLGERGEWGHERFLWEPLVRVPLLVKPAGARQPGRRERDPVSVVDVMPLVLRAAGLPVPEAVQGEAPPARRRPILAEVNPMSARTDTGRWRARWEGPLKLLENSLGGRWLFDVERDPDESDDLAPRQPERAARAEQALEREFAALPPAAAEAPAVQIDPDTLEALRRLGYLDEGADAPPVPGGEAPE